MTCLQNFAHHRRLLTVCAVSAALHLVLVGWLACCAAPARHPAPQPSPRLSVRLSAIGPARPRLAAAAARASAAMPAPVVAPPAGKRTSRPRPSAPVSTSAPQPAASVTTTAVSGQLQGWDFAAEDADADAVAAHRPGYQAVQTPPDAVLSYAITRQVAGQPPAGAGAGRLEWQAGDSGYRLSLRGVMGELESRGLMTDAGFGPLETRAGAGTQTRLTTFNWAFARVNFDRTGASATITSDSQDRASMLMRLAGLGLADAAQLNGTVELLVASADGVAVVRFERIGEETIDSALGELATVHLVQVSQPGSARLDVWLAPSRSWYPVQLRVTAPDGSALTQTVTSIAPR